MYRRHVPVDFCLGLRGGTASSPGEVIAMLKGLKNTRTKKKKKKKKKKRLETNRLVELRS